VTQVAPATTSVTTTTTNVGGGEALTVNRSSGAVVGGGESAARPSPSAPSLGATDAHRVMTMNGQQLFYDFVPNDEAPRS
jgi:hypothetical protein